jgi:hypothetical protein
MKRLFHIVLVLSLLGVVGCSRGDGASSRLVELDSLVAVAPDSAGTLLLDIVPSSLSSDEDRAYYALLTTEACYMADLPIASDSVINVAIDHYADGRGEYDRRIRSLIFKGCVMDDLGQADSAKYWLGRAEAIAHPDDHAHLGYINLRLADLDAGANKYDSTAIARYEASLSHYQSMPASKYCLSVLVHLGALYSQKDAARSQKYFGQAQQLSKQLNTTSQAHQLLEQIAVTAYRDGQPLLTKNCAKQALAMGDLSVGAYACAAIGYSGLRKTDSVLIYLQQMPAPITRVDSMHYHRAHAEYARAMNRMEDYVAHNDRAGQIANAIYLAAQQERLMALQQHESGVLKQRLEQSQQHLWVILVALIVIAIALLALVMKLWRQSRQRRLIEQQLQQTIGQLTQLKSTLAQQESDMTLMKSSLLSSGKKVMCLDEIIRGLHTLQQSRQKRNVALSSTFWGNLEQYVDDNYGDMQHCGLNDTEKKLLGLCCLNVPLEVAARVLDVSPKTIYNYRPVIARKISDNTTANLDDAIANQRQFQADKMTK